MSAREVSAEMLDDMSDDALAEIAESMLAESKILRRNADLARVTLTRRLIDRGATQFTAGAWRGTLKLGAFTHVVEDAAGLRDCLYEAGASDEDLRRAFSLRPATLVVNHRELNELAKRGGALREAIDAYRVSTRSDPTLDLTRQDASE